jgi:hypothetical protein
MKSIIAFLLLAALAHAAAAHGAPPSPGTRHVDVRGARVHAKDLFPTAEDVDLGPSPPLGATRVIDRAEIERAYASANVAKPKTIPSAVKVARKARHLTSAAVASAVKAVLSDKPLPRHATLGNVRASAIDVPAEFHRIAVELPPLPRRAGPTTAQAIVTFLDATDAVLAKAVVPVELMLPPEAAVAEIPRGAPIALIVRKGLVEVTVTGIAAADADVGGVLPITIKPSGRVFRARAIDKGHAVALEDS